MAFAAAPLLRRPTPAPVDFHGVAVTMDQPPRVASGRPGRRDPDRPGRDRDRRMSGIAVPRAWWLVDPGPMGPSGFKGPWFINSRRGCRGGRRVGIEAVR